MKYILILLLSLFLFSCEEKGTTSERLSGNEQTLPPELKGLKIYDVSTGGGGYVKVAVLNNETISTTWKSGKYYRYDATVKAPVDSTKILFENEEIIIIKK